MKKLIQNAIKCPDGKILISTHTHDYKQYTDSEGRVFAVDGGLDYIKRSAPFYAEYETLDLYTDSDIDKIAHKILWGVWIDGKTEFKFLHTLDTEHLKNIAKNCQPSIWILMSIFYLLNERKQLW